MRKEFLLTLSLLVATFATAQDTVAPLQFDMTFAGRGQASNVQSVKVENLSRQTEITLNGGDILRLTNIQTLEIGEVKTTIKVKPLLYPNPSFGAARLVFANTVNGNVDISVTDMLGKTVLQQAFQLDAGKHSVVLPSLKSGVYIVALRGNGVNETIKWLSNGESSTGSIRLEGSNGMELQTESTHYTTQIAQKSDSNIVWMYYEYGQLLRFTGKSGNMTTIVMNQPTLSHPITFDFYECKDAAGRYYPIVNVGGILWMAEDLGVVPSKASLRTSANAWSIYPSGKVAYRNFDENSSDKGGYYNWDGAKAAVPEGWQLPTAGEIDAMFKALGMTPVVDATTSLTTSYSHPRPDLLRGRDNSWSIPETAPDTTSFGAMATGTLSDSGAFLGDGDFKAAFWTRSTNNNQPIWWGFTESHILFNSTQTANLGAGLRVRACRVAPSAYQNVIDLFKDSINAAPKRKIFSNGPLGGSYTASSEKLKIFADYSYIPNSGVVNRDSLFYRYDYANNAYSRTKMPHATLAQGTGVSPYLKKATAIKNGNNRENLVVATWNRPFRMWNFANSTANDFIYGSGTVSLITYNDSLNGYARIDSITLPTTFEMGNYTLNSSNNLRSNHLFPIYIETYEQYVSRFQVLAADFDNDGVDEIVVNLDRKVVVYKKNGSNWTQLYNKTFTTYQDTSNKFANVRIAVGDADGDKTPDIVAIYEQTKGNYKIELYPMGNISKMYTAFNNCSNVNSTDNIYNTPFYDVKIGNVTGHGINTIVAMISPKEAVPTVSMPTPQAVAPTVCLFEHNGTIELNRLTTYSTGQTQSAGNNVAYNELLTHTSPTFNDNITLVNFDGVGSKSDIVAGLDVLTYTDGGSGYGSLSKKTTTALLTSGYFVLPDFMTSGNFNGNEEGKEQLNIMKMKANATAVHLSVKNQTATITTTVEHTIIAVSGSTLSSTSIHPSSLATAMRVQFSLNNDAGYTIGMGENIYHTIKPNTLSETGSIPFVASARSAEASKTLKYVNHQTTMSEPRIYALLAAPPFWKYRPDGEEFEYPNSASMGTAWGKTTTTGSGSSRNSSNKGMVIMGFEYEFEAPVLGINLGGVDFETKLEFETEKSTETTYTETQSIEWVAPENDAVILSATFYDTYTYEIIESENTDEIGGIISISVPESEPRTMALNLEDYKMLMEDNPEAPKLDNLFVHTVGFPFTYPSDKNQIKTNVAKIENDPNNAEPSTVLWAANDGFPEFINVGSGSDCTRSIELDAEKESSTGFNFNLEAQLVVTSAAGLKAGVGYGHGESWANSHSEGVGHAIAGTVPAPANVGTVPNFQWTVCWYKYRLDGQTFPVVYYVVKP
ncbi:MAG: T9SS type A sorting domain-containing protein [Bacteroidales bacterium]|nr:T9SS type A sorting domain-containing protein [Bacteroidales bacterium]